MGREAVAAATDMTGAFNGLALRLGPGASERTVIDRLDLLLAPFGGFGAYGRADQISHRLLRDEIQQNQVTALVVPVVFLGVAAFLLHIVLLRMVATQRTQIALLKAFGYDDADVASHYLRFALIAVALGAVLGVAGGTWLGRAYTAMYAQFFLFPSLDFVASPLLALGAIAIAATAALAGAFSAVREVLRLQPAVGMRAEAPATFRPLFLERWRLHTIFSPAQRMVLRNVERRPVRALLSALGVALALGTLLIGMILLDSVQAMMDVQFRIVQREDVSVGFYEAKDTRALREIARIPGVVRAEPYRVAAIEMSRGPVTRRLGLTGLDPDGTLRSMIDAERQRHPLPHGGVVLTERLARTLRVGPGDTVDVELLEHGAERQSIVVSALVNEMIGVNGYMTLPELHRLLREGPRVSGAYLTLERGSEASVFDALRQLPAVASTTSKTAMIRSFESQMAESLTITFTIVIVLAGILAVGVIYNGARIALSERQRELASLRVLGFSRREVASMLLGEQAIVTALGLPLGAVIGLGLMQSISRAYDTELYRMPVVLQLDTFLIAAAIIAVIAAGAGFLVRLKLDRADLIAVLKTRE
jgi:putative ABC transport system permease protein